MLRTTTRERSSENQLQVFPELYLVREEPSVGVNVQSRNDSTCVPSTANTDECSTERGTPRLIDHDLGPDRGNPSESAELFYSLRNVPLINPYDLRWFEFTFKDTFALKSVRIHYYCLLHNVQLETQLQCQNFGSDFVTVSVVGQPSFNCSTGTVGDRRELVLEVEENNSCVVARSDSKVGIMLAVHSLFKLYVSEMQFFMEGRAEEGIL